MRREEGGERGREGDRSGVETSLYVHVVVCCCLLVLPRTESKAPPFRHGRHTVYSSNDPRYWKDWDPDGPDPPPKSLPDLSFHTSLAVVLLACRWIGSGVTAADVLRWVNVGRIPYHNAWAILKEDAGRTHKRLLVLLRQFFRSNRVISPRTLFIQARRVATTLDVRGFAVLSLVGRKQARLPSLPVCVCVLLAHCLVSIWRAIFRSMSPLPTF